MSSERDRHETHRPMSIEDVLDTRTVLVDGEVTELDDETLRRRWSEAIAKNGQTSSCLSTEEAKGLIRAVRERDRD